MHQDFFRISLPSPPLALGQPLKNARILGQSFRQEAKSDLLVYPPFCLTGASLADLQANRGLLDLTCRALIKLKEESQALAGLAAVSLPLLIQDRLCLALALLGQGRLHALQVLPVDPRDPFFRYFSPPFPLADQLLFEGQEVALLSPDRLFTWPDQPDWTWGFRVADSKGRLLGPPPDETGMTPQLTVVLSLQKAVWGQREANRIRYQALSDLPGRSWALTSPGPGESSTDGVFGGYRLIAEKGKILTESALFQKETLTCDLDMTPFVAPQARTTLAPFWTGASPYVQQGRGSHPGEANPPCKDPQPFLVDRPQPGPSRLEINRAKGWNRRQEKGRALQAAQTWPDLKRPCNPYPFLPQGKDKGPALEEAMTILAAGLARRMQALPGSRPLVGLSGGLDSSLACLISVRACDALARSREDLLLVSMPGPGSQDRTRQNAETLARLSGATFREIPIDKALALHLSDLGHPEDRWDSTYENAQARERTQILMDLANQEKGFVVGTGDLSELALGFCTYNGDTMAMYNVNASVPKTLVRALCQYEAQRLQAENPKLAEVIYDILATPVSPELLPATEEGFPQKTEDILGPYVLHDFFLWHLLKEGAAPQKILDLALWTFRDHYPPETIEETLQIFLSRFRSNQFKRSASPDTASLGLVSLSPRGGLVLPSDLAGPMAED